MDMYNTADLLAALDISRKPSRFLTQMFFPQVALSDKAEVAIDVISGNRKLAPLVMPTVQGRPVRARGFSTKTVAPAYLKPKTPLLPSDNTVRRAGELFSQPLSPAERRMLNISDIMVQQYEQIENRIEWMAAQALNSGAITLVSDDYPETVIDFGRKSTHTISLASSEKWNASTGKPLTNLDTWAALINADGGGAVTDVVMGSSVFSAFRSNPEVVAMYANQQNPGGPLPSLVPTGFDQNDCTYHGQFGQYRIWTTTATYDNDAGVATPYVAAGDVLVIAKGGLNGIVGYGAILDNEVLMPMAVYPKMWTTDDPSATFIMTQSAPITIPANPDSVIRATVL